MQTIIREYQVDKTRIGFIRFILEAYEGIAVMTTLDPAKGLIRIRMAPGREATVFRVIEDLRKDMAFNEV